jgi:hypothetical protein
MPHSIPHFERRIHYKLKINNSPAVGLDERLMGKISAAEAQELIVGQEAESTFLRQMISTPPSHGPANGDAPDSEWVFWTVPEQPGIC